MSAYLKSERAKRDIAPSAEESVCDVVLQARRRRCSPTRTCAELERFVLGAAVTFLEGLRLGPRRLEIERSGSHLFEPGAQEAQHSHRWSLLSCSYYVEAPKDCGCIVMPDPIGARRSYREFTKTAGNDLLTRREIAVEPQPGTLGDVRVMAAALRAVQQERPGPNLDRDESARSSGAGRHVRQRRTTAARAAPRRARRRAHEQRRRFCSTKCSRFART